MRSLAETVKHDIENTEGELADAQTKLATARDSEIQASLELLVERKKQAIIDLREKLNNLEKSNIT